jgi:hypothetical protein
MSREHFWDSDLCQESHCCNYELQSFITRLTLWDCELQPFETLLGLRFMSRQTHQELVHVKRDIVGIVVYVKRVTAGTLKYSLSLPERHFGTVNYSRLCQERHCRDSEGQPFIPRIIIGIRGSNRLHRDTLLEQQMTSDIQIREIRAWMFQWFCKSCLVMTVHRIPQCLCPSRNHCWVHTRWHLQ